MCVFPWPSSCLAALLFALNSAAASTRPGACAITRAQAPHGQPTHSIASIDIDMQHRVSHSLIFKPLPLLVQTSPVLVRVSDQTFSSPPSVPKRSLPARSAPSRVLSQLPVLTACSDGFTSYFDRLRRCSPIQPAPHALPDRTTYTVCFVCLFVRAIPL
jgi:hypothetical protein